MEGKATDIVTILTGNYDGMFGETAALSFFLRGVCWLSTATIRARILIAILATVGIISSFMNVITTQLSPNPLFALLSGSLLLAAFWNATDPVSSRVKKLGQTLYSFLIGVLTVVIRDFTNFPDGVVFSIFIGSSFTSLLDHWGRPKSFGGGAVP